MSNVIISYAKTFPEIRLGNMNPSFLPERKEVNKYAIDIRTEFIDGKHNQARVGPIRSKDWLFDIAFRLLAQAAHAALYE